MLEQTGRYRRSSEVEEVRVGDRSVLYHRGAGKAIILNTTGALVWDHLATSRTARQLIERIASSYPDVPPDQLVDEVARFVKESLEHQIIQPDP